MFNSLCYLPFFIIICEFNKHFWVKMFLVNLTAGVPILCPKTHYSTVSLVSKLSMFISQLIRPSTTNLTGLVAMFSLKTHQILLNYIFFPLHCHDQKTYVIEKRIWFHDLFILVLFQTSMTSFFCRTQKMIVWKISLYGKSSVILDLIDLHCMDKNTWGILVCVCVVLCVACVRACLRESALCVLCLKRVRVCVCVRVRVRVCVPL